jgi:hypothetical protein
LLISGNFHVRSDFWLRILGLYAPISGRCNMSCAEARRGWWRVGIEFRNLGLMDGLFIVVLLFSPIFSIIVSVLGTYFS